MPHYAIQMNDGTVAIMQTVGDTSPADCIVKWPTAERVKAGNYYAIDPAVIPPDRTFRNALAFDPGTDHGFRYDLPKARNILRDRLRAERAPQLAALDVEMLRATTETPMVPSDGIAARKQALRDITDHPAIEAAETVEALKALTLDALTKE